MGKTYIAYIAIVAKAPRLRALPSASQHCGAPHLSRTAAGGHAAADPTKLGGDEPCSENPENVKGT
jgi:hypothetical protein